MIIGKNMSLKYVKLDERFLNQYYVNLSVISCIMFH